MKNDDACKCETIKQSPYSPDVVQDTESVAYIIINPDHWSDKQGLSNAALSKSKLKNHELSIARISYCSAGIIRQTIINPQLDRNPSRREVGALVAICLNIRAIRSDETNDRLICVIDDGKEDYIGHALLGYSDATKDSNFWTRNDQNAVRGNLIRAFSGNSHPIKIDDLNFKFT